MLAKFTQYALKHRSFSTITQASIGKIRFQNKFPLGNYFLQDTTHFGLTDISKMNSKKNFSITDPELLKLFFESPTHKQKGETYSYSLAQSLKAVNSLVNLFEQSPKLQEQIFAIFEHPGAKKKINEMLSQLTLSTNLRSDKLKSIVKAVGYLAPDQMILWNNIGRIL